MKSNNSLKKIFSISAITFLSRILGLFREITITSLLGTTIYSDAFYLAYAIPNLFRRFTAEGAMLSTFIPRITKLNQTKGEIRTREFIKNFFWCLFLLLIIFCIFFILTAPWLISNFFAIGFEGIVLEQNIFLTRLMFSYIFLISIAAFYQGILNTHDIFIPSAFSPLLLNIAIIICGITIGNTAKEATIGLAIGVILGGLAQVLYPQFYIWKLKYQLLGKFNLLDKEVITTLKLMLPGLFSAGIYQLNIVISYMISSQLYSGSITSLTLSNRLMELVLGVLVVSVTTVLLPQLSNLIAKNKITLAVSKLQDSLLLTSFLTLPASVGLIFVGKDLISILFLRGEFTQQSVLLTYQALFFHSFGLFFIAWNRILTTAFHSLQHFKLTAYLAFGALLINGFFCFWLPTFMGHSGVALANSLSQLFLLLLNIIYLPQKLKKALTNNFILPFFKQLLSIAAMILVIWFIYKFFKIESVYFRFATILLFSSLTYLAISYFLKIKEQKEILLLLKRNIYKDKK